MSAAQPHIGLNLVFLVPGETGGMEVYARELIAALLAHAPAEMRFTAFVNRELGCAASTPWGEGMAAAVVPVHARRPYRSAAREASQHRRRAAWHWCLAARGTAACR